MAALLADRKSPPSRTIGYFKSLPPQMRVLYITNRQRTGGWLAEALAIDSASRIDLEEAVGSAAGLTRLRDDAFDAVLVSHEPGELDALDLIEGYRAGGAEEPIIILGTQSDPEMAVLCYEAGADGYVCVHTTTTRNLLWVVSRAMQRHQLVRENQRLQQGEHARLQREQEESQRLLHEQEAMLNEFDAVPHRSGAAGVPAAPLLPLPPELVTHYRELLRVFVIMGSGNLAGELQRLAELLVSAALTPRQAMRLHLTALEELVQGLGTRSTRHVMNRADLLILELTMYMAEGYRRRYQQRIHPPLQQLLPGFA